MKTWYSVMRNELPKPVYKLETANKCFPALRQRVGRDDSAAPTTLSPSTPNRHSLTFSCGFCDRIVLFLPIVSILPIIRADTMGETFILDFDACVAPCPPFSRRVRSSGPVVARQPDGVSGVQVSLNRGSHRGKDPLKMLTKRFALWLAIGGATAATWGAVGPATTMLSAQETFVSDAVFKHDPIAETPIERIGYQDDDGYVTSDEVISTYETEYVEEGCYECEDDAVGGLLVDGCRHNFREPFSLFGQSNGIVAGGWAQLGYFNKALPSFNSRPNEFQLQQMWVYAEKRLDTSNGFDFGGRVDYIYGTDGPDTQAFGIDNGSWDNNWDNGPDNSGYGQALPQAYGEVGYGDLSVKIGHFFSIVGYETVAAPDNFFYSHTYTMYHSEPFTHTGALAKYNMNEDLTLFGGYTMGWNGGFEDNGDTFLGGISWAVTDNYRLSYTTSDGRVGKAFPNGGDSERGFLHSIVSDATITDRIEYISQVDVLQTEDGAGNSVRDTFSYNSYLLYTVSDCLALGGRFEWYDAKGIFANDVNAYDATLGANIKPHANVLIRPEIRWDWIDGDATGILANNSDQQTTFGIDSIFLF